MLASWYSALSGEFYLPILFTFVFKVKSLLFFFDKIYHVCIIRLDKTFFFPRSSRLIIHSVPTVGLIAEIQSLLKVLAYPGFTQANF